MLRTDDARRRTPDDGRRTMDRGPSTPYYKLTGELKMVTSRYRTSMEYLRKLLVMLYSRTEKVANDDEKKALKALKESYFKGWQVTEMERS